MLPLKTGAFSAAIANGVPILPVVFQHYHFLDTVDKRLGSATVRYRVLEPLPTRGLDCDGAADLAEQTRGRMLEALRELGCGKEE